MPAHAIHRVKAGKSVPGVVIVSSDAPIGQAIEDLLLLLQVVDPEEMANRLLFVPL
jgi:hypothetical protein